MDTFIVVNFEVDNTLEPIREQWIISDTQCYFPSTNEYNKHINNSKTRKEIIQSWNMYDMKVIRRFRKYIFINFTRFYFDTHYRRNSKLSKFPKKLNIENESIFYFYIFQ